MLFKEVEVVWNQILSEIEILMDKEPILTGFYYSYILQHKNFDKALSYILSDKLSNNFISSLSIRDIIDQVYSVRYDIVQCAIQDIKAICFKNYEVNYYSIPLLYCKGFHALQIYRISNFLWYHGRKSLALYFRNQILLLFSADIHPASIIGSGIMLNNSTGITIGETTIIENDVFISQCVTLGEIGRSSSDIKRHPTIKEGVIIGIGAIILGDIEIGFRAKIGAGSVVLESILPDSIVN